MYLEYNRVKSIVEYLEASNKSKKMPFKFSKNEYISNKLPKVKQKVENYVQPFNHSKFVDFNKALFSQLNSYNPTFNEVIKNSDKIFDLSYLMKPKQDESLIHIHKSFKESAPKPFKNSKSALELVNNNITKIIEIYSNKSPEIKAKERENISLKQDQIHNLTDLKNRGRNSDILDVTNVRKEKETIRKFEHLAGNDKTHNLTLFNNSTNNLSLIKAPRFENNKLFIALGKQTLKKKKR